MRVLRVVVLVLGGALLLCGFIAVAQMQLYGQKSGVFTLIPALVLPLPRSLLGGGDFPPDLSFAGVVVIYLVPGTVLTILGYLLPLETPRAEAPREGVR